jgi:DNA-binding response OmpR family regulator
MDSTETPRAAVLLVEDDPDATRLLTDILEGAGYRVTPAENAAEARVFMERSRPDLIILDLGLPDADGLVLCSRLKAVGDVPIIICSAAQDKRDRVLGLKLGADDFISKPFDLDEFEARVEAVLRRAGSVRHSETSAPDQLRVGELIIDRQRRKVTLGGQSISLTPTEFRLLSALASRPDDVLTREELAQLVWGTGDMSGSRTIDVHIQRLRSKLTSGASAPLVINSVRGYGYRLECEEGARAAPLGSH